MRDPAGRNARNAAELRALAERESLPLHVLETFESLEIPACSTLNRRHLDFLRFFGHTAAFA
jgi:hypothetical protein